MGVLLSFDQQASIKLLTERSERLFHPRKVSIDYSRDLKESPCHRSKLLVEFKPFSGYVIMIFNWHDLGYI